MRKKNGFTLVELLSTIVVLGIIFSIAIFLVIKNINNAKENMDLITYNNIKSAAKIYTDDTGAYWYTKDNYEYSCVSLGDLIELGYFDEKVIDRNDKISKNSQLKIIRDKDSKVIKETSFSFEKSILPDVNCNYQSNVSISTNYKGNKVKNVDAKIVYSTSNTDYYRYIYLSEFGEDTITTNDVVYSCKEIGNCSNEPVSNLKSGQLYLAKNDVVRLNVKSNGKILAYINYDNENIAESSKIINATFDNTPPIITLKVYKISSYEGNTPKTKGELLTTISGNYSESTWKNYGYWFDISTNEYSTIKWTYNNAGSTNSGNPSNSGANCNTSCSKTLSGDGSRIAIIEAIDEAGNSSKVEINVYIDRTAPTINVIEQRCSNKDNCLGNLIGNKIEKSTNTNVSIEDKNWSYNSFNIKYNASDSMSAVKEIRILQNVSGVYNKLNTTMTSNNIVNNNSNITISEPGQRYVQVIAYDSAGNSSVANIIAYISNIITIEYNSNGGEGAPTAQNKVYSKDIILSSTKPTRTGYTYASWNTKSDGSGTSYQPGSKYTSNESATLYAQWNINTYNITYNLNGGTKGTNAPTSGTYGSTITVSNPSKTGYTFAGWTVSGTGASLTGTNLKIGTGNITLTANWTINTYTISYNLNGGTKGSNAPTSGTYGSTVTVSNPSKTGYTFAGWTVSGSGASLTGTSLTIGTGNITLTANWNINTYTISYNLNGGTKGTNAPTSGTYGSTVTVSNPSKTGYTFAGWTVSGTGASLTGTNLKIGTGNITLTANWTINTYTISYNLNGGTKGTNAPTSGTYGSTVTVSNPSKTGYTFAGWTVSGTGASLTGTNLTIGTGNITLTANWNINYYYLDLNGLLDGSSSGNITGFGTADVYINGKLVCNDCTDYYDKHSYGSSYSISDIKTATGHTYNGIYKGSASGTIGTSNVYVQLNFSTNTYTINYELNGGTKETNAPTSGKYGNTVTVNNPSKTGYTFTGWTVSGTGASLTGTSLTIGAGNITLTANWNINTYTITYELNGGTKGTSAPTSGTYGSTVTVSNPSKTGYTFNGWAVSGTGATMSGTNLKIGPSNVTLTANWSASEYTISYNLNGGTKGTNAPTSGKYGSTVTVSNPSKTGYTFTGWTVSGSGSSLTGTSLTIGTGNITLTANWKANAYTINYNANGGTGTMTSTTATYDSTVSIKTNAFTKTGYSFVSWTTNSNGTDDGYNWTGFNGTWKYTNGQYGISDSKLNLYAIWRINTYTISYNLNGGTKGTNAPTSGAYGSTATVSNPSKTGYTFAGWTVSGTGASLTDTNLKIGAGNIILTANWNINTYTITYELNGGTKGTNAPTSGTYGSTVIVSNPSKTGYTFAGWTVSGTGATLTGTSLTIGTGNITLTANWNINYYYLDLNGLLDGSSSGNITGFGTADVYINGKLVCNDCTDYYDKHPYGSSYSISNIKTATGRTYNGIYSGSASGTIGTSTVYVQLSFSTNTYTINYELNGGTKGTNAPTSGKCGSTVTVSNPSKTGYTFTGWTVSGSGSSLTGTSLTIGAGNITLTANWKANTYTINYNANGGTGTMTSTTATYDSTVSIKTNAFTKTGYSFVSWTTNSNGTDDGYNWTGFNGTWKYTNGQYGISDSKLNLYAIWRINAYTISYNLNGGTKGTNAPTSGTYGSTVTVSNPSKTGYTFAGWTVSGTGASLTGTNLKIGAGNITLTANWTINTYTISYNLNGGTKGTNAPTSGTYGSTVTVSNPSKTGYTFAGWTVSGTGASLTGTNLKIGAGNITLTANWTINTYTISYNLNGGTKGTNAPTSGTYGSTVIVSNPSKTGYTFTGWTVSGTGAALTGTNLKIGTGNITLTANWNINYYYLDLNGLLDGSSSGNITGFGTADVYINGKLVCNDCTDYYDKHPYGSSYSISNIKTATGHTYNGIYSGSASGTIGTSNVYVQLSFSTNTYTITYELNGGTKGANAPTSGKYGSTVTVSNPSRNNYTFTGWTVSGTGSSLSGTSLTIGAGNITLTANWKMKRSIPDFSYTGSYEIVNDSNTKIDNINTYIGNWKIRFLSSGTLKFNDLYNASNGIDIFIVGGGGSGAPGSDYIAQGNHGGSGGGGGAALTIKKLPVSTGISYSIIVGDIVGEATANSSFGTSREAYFTALAGSTPIKPYYISNQEGWAIPIGSGGTGRLSGQTNNYGAQNVISKVGGAGNGADGNYEFNETGNIRYGAGGGNGGSGVSTGQGGYGTLGITGGPDGGGTGGQGCSYAQITASRKYYIVDAKDGNAGTENTGSGGGGGGGRCGSSSTSHGERGLGGNGASGIVIIRNAR